MKRRAPLTLASIVFSGRLARRSGLPVAAAAIVFVAAAAIALIAGDCDDVEAFGNVFCIKVNRRSVSNAAALN